MSKKRVHEIAKELNKYGIELDNKDVVTELVSLGYDVKSHSSSLEDDQATAAVQKIVDKRKPKAPPPAVAPKGFMVRRKVGLGTQEELHAAPVAPSDPAMEAVRAPEAPPPAAARAPEPPPPDAAESPAVAAQASEPPPPAAAEPPPAAAAKAPEPPPAAVEPPPAAAAKAPEPPPAVAAKAPEHPPAAAPPMAARAPEAPQRAPEPPRAPPSAPSHQAPRAPGSTPLGSRPPTSSGQRPALGGSSPRPSSPGFRPAQVISRPTSPVPPRPPPGRGPSGVRPGAHAGGQAGGERQMRPTATQAVVISRPAVSVRRVTPSSSAHKNIPMAPGRKAIGEVREFKVVPDHLGRGRELVDVTKKKEGTGGKKRTAEKDGQLNKQEISDLMWGRVSIPLRGKKRKPTKKGAKTQITEMAEEKKVIKLQEAISVSDLGQRMGVKTSDIIKKLMTGGTMATANQMLDADTAAIIATDYGWKVEKVGFEVEDHLPEVEEKAEDERPRPPVVTVMGHVDHGKTSLLDAIRAANVAAGEAGGITQHIGAYTVTTSKGDITFLDTPGHEAFTAMRARGATVTDIVVLVVAADDGVMPQTVEALNHAKAAKVPIVVAINKMDVNGANPERVKQDLAKNELVPEDWGGDTIMVPVSARTKAGIDLLLENLALQAEVLELTANPARPAVGAIIEAKLEKGRGAVATVLVREGTLRTGDSIVSGVHSGKVRALTNSRGESIKEVFPGYSAEVIGLDGVPTAGDVINVVEDERSAKEIAEHRETKARQAEVGKTSRESLEALLAKTKAGESKELRVVLKADVQGSLEAVSNAVSKLSTHKVKVDIVHRGVGAITETDVMLAAASKGLVVGFNIRPESGAEATAKAQEVPLHMYSIIYELIDGVRRAMEGMLEPIRSEKRLGRAEVRSLFNVPKLGTIAGAAVVDGTIKRTALIRLLRDNKQVYTGKLASLRRFKDDVREVAQGFECGIGIENYNDLKPGDIIEAYEIEETRPSLT
ncbi:MAG TPA: translation initiation factor IF-2 [Myxococcaceae bacterium]|nr:translation initiation factor IF-2 [Myxococcaceae bacterium]